MKRAVALRKLAPRGLVFGPKSRLRIVGCRKEGQKSSCLSRAPELDKEFANLEIMPATLNRRKGAKVGARQLAYIDRFVAAEVISEQVAARIRRTAPGSR